MRRKYFGETPSRSTQARRKCRALSPASETRRSSEMEVARRFDMARWAESGGSAGRRHPSMISAIWWKFGDSARRSAIDRAVVAPHRFSSGSTRLFNSAASGRNAAAIPGWKRTPKNDRPASMSQTRGVVIRPVTVSPAGSPFNVEKRISTQPSGRMRQSGKR